MNNVEDKLTRINCAHCPPDELLAYNIGSYLHLEMECTECSAAIVLTKESAARLVSHLMKFVESQE